MTTGVAIKGRASTKKVNSFSKNRRETKLETTAANAPLPIVYGEDTVPGLIGPYDTYGGDLYIMVIWCAGPVKSIERVYINGELFENGGKIIARHYRGTSLQKSDDWMADAIAGFDDDLVLLKPEGVIAAAYSIFRIEAGELSNAPSFQAVIQGCCDIFDSNPGDDYVGISDPFHHAVGFSFHWEGTNGTSPTDLDASINSHTLGYNGDADIQGNMLDLDGTGDYCYISDAASVEFGTGAWCLEIKATPTGVGAGIEWLVSKADGSTDGFRFGRDGSSARIEISSDGVTNDILEDTFSSGVFSAGVESTIIIEYQFGRYVVYIDDEQRKQTNDSNTVFNNVVDWQFGASAGANEWTGKIRSVRFTKGYVRCGGPCLMSGLPFYDSSEYNAQSFYTDNAALCLGHMGANPVYGQGSNVLNITNAKDWADSEIENSEKRARLSLVISDSRPTSEYMDLLATYAECFWTHEGSDVKLIPDRPCDVNNPSGQQFTENHLFNTDSDWSPGTGWSHASTVLASGETVYYYVHASSTAQSTISQTLDALDPGGVYAIKIGFWHVAGTHRVRFNGTEIVADYSTAGLTTHALLVTADESYIAPVIEFEADADCNVLVFAIEVRRLYWLETRVRKNTLTIEGVSSTDTPTKVVLRYKEPDASSANWPDKIATAQLPEVLTGEIPLIETTITMLGCFREEEADSKAQAKLARLQDRNRYTWESTDSALLFQVGTVIQLQIDGRELDTLVMADKITMIEPGRYLCTGMNYSDNHWPDEYASEPVSTGKVPNGAIILLKAGASVPTGWSSYSDANGKYLVGAGLEAGDPDVDDTGGSLTYAGFTSSTASDGGHNGQSGDAYETESIPVGGSTSDYIYSDDNSLKDDHSHSIATGLITSDILRRRTQLIEKTGGSATVFPENGILFGLGGLTITNLSRSTSSKGRLVMADSVTEDAGESTLSVSFTTGSAGVAHDHHTRVLSGQGDPSINVTPPRWDVDTLEGGPHTHDGIYDVLIDVQRYISALYICDGEVAVQQGQIIAWAGSMTTMPEDDWTLCNGLLGTPPLAGRFIEIANNSNDGKLKGDNKIYLSGTTDQGGDHAHNDEGSYTTGYTHGTKTLHHRNTFTHAHEVDEEDDFTPSYYALAFLMYNPTPTLGFEDVALLISGGEADGSTTIVDDSDYNESATVTGGTGTLEYQDAISYLGLSTIRCNGHKVAYDSGFEYGRKMTVEGIFVTASLASEQILFSNTEGGTGDFTVVLETDGDVALIVDGSKVATIAAGIGVYDGFYVALNYDQNEWRLYVGRVAVGTATVAKHTDADVDIPTGLYVVSDSTGTGGLNGWFVQFRVTRGAARHSANVIGISGVAFPTS